MSLKQGSSIDYTLEIQSLITVLQNLGVDEVIIEEALKNRDGGHYDSRKIIGLLKLICESLGATQEEIYISCQNRDGGHYDSRKIIGLLKLITAYCISGGGTGGSKPEGTISITENGTHDVTEYASAEVMVQSGDGWNVVDALNDGSITEISANWETVRAHLFRGCKKLTSANIPLVKSIGDYAFYECNFTEANFPSAASIGSYAFQRCSNLTEINLPLVTTVGDYGFCDCNKLTEINLPLVTTVGKYSFGTTGSSEVYITEINLPLVTTVGNYGFCRTRITEITLPLAVNIGENAFNNCSHLETAVLPCIQTVARQMFNYCGKLKTLVLKNETVVTLSNVNAFTSTPFASNGTGGVAYVPQNLIADYEIATNWSSLNVTFLPIEGSEYE